MLLPSLSYERPGDFLKARQSAAEPGVPLRPWDFKSRVPEISHHLLLDVRTFLDHRKDRGSLCWEESERTLRQGFHTSGSELGTWLVGQRQEANQHDPFIPAHGLCFRTWPSNQNQCASLMMFSCGVYQGERISWGHEHRKLEDHCVRPGDPQSQGLWFIFLSPASDLLGLTHWSFSY